MIRIWERAYDFFGGEGWHWACDGPCAGWRGCGEGGGWPTEGRKTCEITVRMAEVSPHCRRSQCEQGAGQGARTNSWAIHRCGTKPIQRFAYKTQLMASSSGTLPFDQNSFQPATRHRPTYPHWKPKTATLLRVAATPASSPRLTLFGPLWAPIVLVSVLLTRNIIYCLLPLLHFRSDLKYLHLLESFFQGGGLPEMLLNNYEYEMGRPCESSHMESWSELNCSINSYTAIKSNTEYVLSRVYANFFEPISNFWL